MSYERPVWHGSKPFIKFSEFRALYTADLLEKIYEALRCQVTTTDGLAGTPPIECFLPQGHQGHHRTKENGEWTWEF